MVKKKLAGIILKKTTFILFLLNNRLSRILMLLNIRNFQNHVQNTGS